MGFVRERRLYKIEEAVAGGESQLHHNQRSSGEWQAGLRVSVLSRDDPASKVEESAGIRLLPGHIGRASAGLRLPTRGLFRTSCGGDELLKRGGCVSTASGHCFKTADHLECTGS